jgi:hypothetical protein
MPGSGEGRAQGPAHRIDHHEDQGHGTPYTEGWTIYLDAGWTGPIPIARSWRGEPSDGKFPPAAGFTGRRNAGIWPTVERMAEWAAEPHRWGNLALRMPDDVIGFDCDAYDGKHGDRTMDGAEERWGELPATWRSSSRGLDPDEFAGWDSGIYFYRVPSGLQWPGKLPGGDVEVIQHGHRYAIVWPSVHPSGRLYRWWDDYGEEMTTGIVPSPVDFPDLPASWVAGLAGGEMTVAAPVDLGEAQGWATEGIPCQAVRTALAGSMGGSRHGTALRLQVKLLRLGEQGHQGVRSALLDLRLDFLAGVTMDGSRTVGEAATEWDDMLTGAAAQITSRTPEGRKGCCIRPALTLSAILERHGGRA